MLLALLLTATTAWAFEATIELESGPYVYKGNDTPVKPAVISVVFDGVEVELGECTITYGKNCVAGKDKGTVQVEYNGGVAVMKFDIQRAPLTVTAASATKVYDGTPLTDSGFTLEGLMSDDTYPTVTVTGSQTEVGSSYNVPSNFDLPSGIEANYDVTYVNGTLTVTWQGAGTLADPYIINNTGGLDMLATNVNAGNDYEDTYFQLGDDITYTHKAANEEGADTESNYTAIGCMIGGTKYPFKGHFDGNGKTISGIRIYKGDNDNSDRYQGLFGIISGTAEVKNVTLADARITGSGYTAGIVGRNEKASEEEYSGTVSNCHVLSNVTIHAVLDYTDLHGGIVGSNSGSVSGCTSVASITTASGLKGCVAFGGIVGSNSGSVTDCLYLGTTLSGNLLVGAIAGHNSNTVKNCYYTSTTITGKDQSGNEIANASCAVAKNYFDTITNCGLAQNTITLGTGVALTNATDYTFNGTGLTGYGDFALSYNDGTNTNIYVLEGAIVTINYNGGAAIPTGKLLKVIDAYENEITLTDNNNGTYSFTMPDNDVNAALYKDFSKCKAYVPDPIYHAYYDHCYFYDGTWNENHGGIKVWDPEGNELTYGTDYRFSMLIDDDLTDWQKVGDHCRIILVGCGEWAGQLTANVVIIEPGEDSGTWGTNLSWNYDGNGKLTITGKGAMNEANSYDAYPWYTYHSVITSVVIGEGITSVAKLAFGGNQNAIVYGDLATVSLPSTLESIDDNAFAYCTALTVDLDDILENTKVTLANISPVTPFNQVGKFIGTLYNGADNAQVFEIMAFAQKAKVTIKGRKLWRDGDWNTLCLPFKVEKTGIFADATIKQLDVTGIYDNKQTGIDGTTLNLYFKDATSIEAGMPYLIKWETTGDPITDDLVFDDVKVYGPMHDVTSQDNKVTFKGNYSKLTWDTENKSILFLGAANKLYWPKPDGDNILSLGAFRAYFQLSDGQQVSAISMNFGDDSETTEIIEVKGVKEVIGVNDKSWYTINGVKLNGLPTQKGVYIHGNKKIMVK